MMHKSTLLGCFFVQKNRLNPTIKNVIFFKHRKILCKRKKQIACEERKRHELF